MKISRRLFLQNSLCASAGILMGCRTPSESPKKELPRPCTPEAWSKQGIVLEPTEVWEGDHIQNFTTSAEPTGNEGWRIWYSVSDTKKGYAIGYAEGTLGRKMTKVRAVCSPHEPADGPLSLGNLPRDWKPVQPSHVRMPDGKHRLYFWAHGPEICRCLVAESNDGRRFRVIDPLNPLLYHPNDRAAFGVPSPDGIMYRKDMSRSRPAGETLAPSRLISNDATTIYILPDGTFELYSVALVRVSKEDRAYIALDNAPGMIRVIDRYTSEDGLHFENRHRVIQRDSQDPFDQQFYYLSVTSTPKGRVGLLGHYRCAAQTTDLEWCFSPDGLSWQRPFRHAWLPRGAPQEPDCYGIYPGSQLVWHNGLWHLFYTGVNSSHNGRHSYGKSRQVIMHATTKSIWG